MPFIDQYYHECLAIFLKILLLREIPIKKFPVPFKTPHLTEP